MAWTKRQGIMLCQPLDEKNLDRNFKSFPRMLAQPKLDGIRCWIDWIGDEPQLISSEGNLIVSVPHIVVLLKDWAKRVGHIKFDGELYNHNFGFEKIVSVARRGADNLHMDFCSLQYHIFDYKSESSNGQRLIGLREMFDAMPESVQKEDVIKMVPTTSVGRKGVDLKLSDYVSAGYEGIILRNPLAPYLEKRPWTILKWKPSKCDTYTVIAVDEAISEQGEHLGRVGALVCADRFGNQFKVGPGLGITHEKAQALWVRREELIGHLVQVTYQNLTKAGVPRFGKFNLDIAETNVDEVHY